jgi:hypothetical protein
MEGYEQKNRREEVWNINTLYGYKKNGGGGIKLKSMLKNWYQWYQSKNENIITHSYGVLRKIYDRMWEL